MPPRSYHIFAGGGDSTFPSSGGAGAPRRGGAPAPEPIPEYRRVRTVFIHNMPPEIGEKELIRLAMPFGEIERVHYAWHMTGEKRGLPRGFATVEYKDISCAEAAIAGINGQTHYSRTIRARAFTDSSFDEHDQSGSGADRGPSSQSASSGAAEGSLSSLPLRAKIATLEAHLRALEDAEEVPAGGAGEERLVFPEQAAALERAAGATAAGQGVSDRGRHSNDRDSDRHRDRDRARDYDHERGRGRDYDRNDRDRDRDRGRDYDRDYDRDRDRGHSDRGRNWDRDSRSR